MSLVPRLRRCGAASDACQVAQRGREAASQPLESRPRSGFLGGGSPTETRLCAQFPACRLRHSTGTFAVQIQMMLLMKTNDAAIQNMPLVIQ